MNWQQKHVCAINFHYLFVATAFVLISSADVYGAGIASPSTRVSAAGDKFDGVTQVAAAFRISRWRLLRANHFELAVGPVLSSGGNEVFASFGPVWRTPLVNDRYFAEVGIAPTFISGSTFRGRDLGGHLHFTSFVSTGVRFGGRNALSLRVQHISNGGLSETNPGMDMVGLEYSFSFSE